MTGAGGAGGPRARAWFGRVEIPSPNPSRAATFYRRVFGWSAREVETSGEPYLSLRPHPGPAEGPTAAVAERRAEGGPAAGEPAVSADPTSVPESAPPAGGGLTTPRALGSSVPLAVIHVEGLDLSAVLERIELAGGRVDLPPTAVGTHGTFARFADPDGNLLGLWASAPAAGGDFFPPD